ncbi:MAG TPA: phenylalanine--tRNA ligase subunit beta [Candidatus Thermoplasmatota archaeon]|nr:phenylalanine--tRNA ligase subunit beta [Candidatus Thermoplasmatota archaeon]
MPVIRFEVAELERLLRKSVPRAELAKTIPQIGADVEDSSGETWAVEFFPDRPDLFTVEGIARALRAWYGVEPGLRLYEARPSGVEVRVDPSVAGVRPHIAAAFVRGVDMTETRLKALIDLQEDLHWGLGARRRRVAIGIHDASVLAPPFTYTTWGLDERSFVPLYETQEMTPREILAKHEKGVAYAHLLAGHERVPIILDAKGGVVSLPPVINAARTAVTTRTRDVFLDVTGTDRWAVERTLNMLATALVESGGALESVDVAGRATPDLAPEEKELKVAEANALLGTSFSADEVAANLRRMGFGATAAGDAVRVQVPPYRADILHTWDLVEDVAIGHGIFRMEPAPLVARTVGVALPENRVAELARKSLVGLGFLETMNLTLSNERDQFARMQRPPAPVVKVLNPVTEDVTLLRPTLLPGLMSILKKNAHRDLPQRLFEVGMVTRLDGDNVHNERHVAGVVIAGRSSFSEIKGIVLALARDLGWQGAEVEVAKAEDPAFVPGRCAALGHRGVFGEVHPAALEAFGLAHPVVAFELRLARGPGGEVRDARA